MNVRSRTSHAREEEVVALLREIHGLMKLELRERSGEFGLSPWSRKVVVLVRVTREPGLTMNELGRMAAIPKSQVSSLVAQLVREGLLRKVPDRNDQRLVRLMPTAAGRRQADRWRAAFRELVGRRVRTLTDDESAHLLDGLRALREAYVPARAARSA